MKVPCKKIKKLIETLHKNTAEFNQLFSDIDRQAPKSERSNQVDPPLKKMEEIKAEMTDLMSEFLVIKETFVWTDKEGQETAHEIKIDFSGIIKYSKKFYQDMGVDLPDDFEHIAIKLFNDNKEEIMKEVKNLGYDHILIIPEKLPDLHTLLEGMPKDYGKLYGELMKENSDDQEKAISTINNSVSREDRFRLLLLHKSKRGDDQPVLDETFGKNIWELTGLSNEQIRGIIRVQGDLPVNFFASNGNRIIAEGLTFDEYVILQKQSILEDNKALDTDLYSWLLASFYPDSPAAFQPLGRILGSGCNIFNSHLRLFAEYFGKAEQYYNCRLCRCFT